MLRWRLLLSGVFIGLLVVLCWLDQQATTPGTWLLPLAILCSLVASEELLGLLAARGLRPIAWVVYLGNLLIVLSNYAALWWPEPLGRLGWPFVVFGLLLLVAFLAEMGRYTGPGRVMESLGLTIFAFAYVGVLLSFVVQLRLLGPNSAWGVAALASLVIVVKMCDTGAYTVGRLIGRHKMSPLLSPGKTIEGGCGGIAFALLGAWVFQQFLVPAWVSSSSSAASPPAWGWIVFGIVVGLAGMLGDLAESLIKRDVGRKDSSTWMPGFGGALDLLDSILLGAPVAYLGWICGLVGP